MANTIRPLTDTEVKQTKIKEKEYSLSDDKGLLLRVKPAGSKLWLFNYTRLHTKKRANLSLGSYPDLSLTLARKKAQELRELLLSGIDPKEHRVEQSRKEAVILSNTFENIAIKWLKLKQPNISASYYKAITSRFDRFIYPKLGGKPIQKIYAVDAIEVLTPIAEEEKLETVKKLCRWINEVMIYAVNTGLIHANPLAGIGGFKYLGSE